MIFVTVIKILKIIRIERIGSILIATYEFKKKNINTAFSTTLLLITIV